MLRTPTIRSDVPDIVRVNLNLTNIVDPKMNRIHSTPKEKAPKENIITTATILKIRNDNDPRKASIC
jgi:hypothetical protein